MSFDFSKLGASLLASGPILMQFANDKKAWWAGLSMTIIGPFLLAMKPKQKKP